MFGVWGLDFVWALLLVFGVWVLVLGVLGVLFLVFGVLVFGSGVLGSAFWSSSVSVFVYFTMRQSTQGIALGSTSIHKTTYLSSNNRSSLNSDLGRLCVWTRGLVRHGGRDVSSNTTGSASS